MLCILPVEALCLDGQQMLDVSAAGEDSLQVDPATLHINPHIKQGVDTVQFVLPGQSILLKFLEKILLGQ